MIPYMGNSNQLNTFMSLRMKVQNASSSAIIMLSASIILMTRKLNMVTVYVGCFIAQLTSSPNGLDNVPTQQERPNSVLYRSQRKTSETGVVVGHVSS